MKFHESRGPSLKRSRELKREQELHHMVVVGHPRGTSQKPAWLIEHHISEAGDAEPTTYEFHNGADLLDHVREHAAVPDEHLAQEGE